VSSEPLEASWFLAEEETFTDLDDQPLLPVRRPWRRAAVALVLVAGLGFGAYRYGGQLLAPLFEDRPLTGTVTR
jgi:hypothetical protein